MKTQLILKLAALSASLAAPASAQGPNWDLIEIGYAQLKLDGIDGLKPSGFMLSGSKLLNDNTFITGSYSQLSDDLGGFSQNIKFDIDMASVGLGYRYAYNNSSDLYATLSYEYIKASAGTDGFSQDEDDNGYGLTVGIRSMVTDVFEVDAAIGYVSGGGIDDGSRSLTIGGNYYFTDKMAVGLHYELLEDADTAGINLRYTF